MEEKLAHGGRREGAGRKNTGIRTKQFTLTLPFDAAALLEKQAAECGMSVNAYIRKLVLQAGQYNSVHLSSDHVD